jgi:hypothetical protein
MKKSNTLTSRIPKQNAPEVKEKHDWHKRKREEEIKRFEEIEEFGLEELDDNLGD